MPLKPYQWMAEDGSPKTELTFIINQDINFDVDGGRHNKSYIMLDQSRVDTHNEVDVRPLSPEWLVSHSIGHALGLEDDNSLAVLIGRRQTIMSYNDLSNPAPRGVDIMELQGRYGYSSASDFFVGSPHADTLFAGGGDDTVQGGDGADLLYGNQGDDLIDGGDGADTVFGGQGNDTIFAASADDFVYGNKGDDELHSSGGYAHGGQGNDTLFADGGVVYGGVGADCFVLTNGAVAGDFNASQGDWFL